MSQEIYDKQGIYEKGIDAIAYQDIEKLKEAIDEGFYLQGFFKTHSTSGTGDNLFRNHVYSDDYKNILPFINVITSGWIEGWKVLINQFDVEIENQFFDDYKFPAIWEISAQYSEKEILSDLVSKFGFDPKFKNEEGQTTVHLIYDAIKQDPIVSISSSKVIDCLNWCKQKGLNIYETYPGVEYIEYDIAKYDISREGHSVWSYAMRQNAWEIADYFFPTSWYDITKSKKWQYTLYHFKELIELRKYYDPRKYALSKDPDKEYILSIWNKFLNNFLQYYIQFSDDSFDQPKDFKYIINMDKDCRQVIWEKYNKKNSEGKNSWFDIISHIDNDLLYNLINQAIEDGQDISDILSSPDKLGETPLFLWAANINVLEEPHSFEKTVEHINFINSLNEEAKNSVDEYTGFSIKQTLYNTIKVWAMYDKSYKPLLDDIK